MLLRTLLVFLSATLLLAACSDEPNSQKKTPLDSGVPDVFTDVDAPDSTDTADVAELPEFACTEGWRAFPLGEPQVQTTSAFSTPTRPDKTHPRKLDPQLETLRPSRQVDVLVYRRGHTGQLVHKQRRITVAQAQTLAGRDDVVFVAHRTPMATTVDLQRKAVKTDVVQEFAYLDEVPIYTGLTGEGVRVVVADSGVDDRHPDFHRWSPDGEDLGSRVTGPGPIDGEGHGTHVAGLIAGNGTGSEGSEVQDLTGEPYQFRGHAPEVSEIISVPMGSYNEDLQSLVSAEGYVFNHSHTFSGGAYDQRVADYDRYLRNGFPSGPPRPVVVAAANNGSGSDYWWAQAQGYHSVLTPGKNTICVGSVHANDLNYAPAASIGPTFDGRIKPDLVAPGHRDYRPLDGMDVAFEEIRLHAKAESGARDLVWRFDDPEQVNGWKAEGAFDAEPTDGLLAVHTVARGGDRFVLEPAESIAADDYEKLTFRMKLDLENGDEHRWPRFYVVRWDRDGDGSNDAHAYPRYADAKKDGQWHTYEFTLADKPRRWKEQMHRMIVRPLVFDDRIISPKKEKGYGHGGGTSLAAPVVTGVVALMLEQLAEVHDIDLERASPLPSTFKALLIHTAKDLFRDNPPLRDVANPDTGEAVVYHQGPDYATGYGLVDAEKAVGLIAAHTEVAPRYREEEIAAGQVHTYRIPVTPGAKLRVTLAWDDAPGDPTSDQLEPKLVNDLDLVAVAPDGTGHSPWLLDPLPIDPSNYMQGIDPIETTDVKPARRCAATDFWNGDTECVDRRNNVEQVVVDAPAEGYWEVRVRGFEVPQGPQKYSLVVTQTCE